MSEAGGFLFFHFYYPPAGQSGEYFRWKEFMHSFDDFFRLQVIMIQLSSRSLLRNLLAEGPS